MRDLNYQLKQLCHRNRDSSYATQAKRMHHLMLIADQLHDLGFLAGSHAGVSLVEIHSEVEMVGAMAGLGMAAVTLIPGVGFLILSG